LFTDTGKAVERKWMHNYTPESKPSKLQWHYFGLYTMKQNDKVKVAEVKN